MPVQEIHDHSITKSALLSSYQMPYVIPLLDVIRVLNDAQVNFVLVGAHGLAGWRRKPRATEDVDVVVAAKQLKKAAKALVAAFPNLEAVDLPVVIRLRDKESHDVAIDVMKPLQQPHREIFKHTHRVQSAGLTFRVPTLEMAITMKFASMTSLYRADADKYLDAHDFIYMVKENPELDRDKLAELGCLLYAEGGKDLLELVRKAQAGEKLPL